MTTIDSTTIYEHNGFTILADITPDLDTTPYEFGLDADPECADIYNAWVKDEWHYVTLAVRVLYGIRTIAYASISGVEHGYFENAWHDGLDSDHARSLIVDLIPQALNEAADEWSDISPI